MINSILSPIEIETTVEALPSSVARSAIGEASSGSRYGDGVRRPVLLFRRVRLDRVLVAAYLAVAASALVACKAAEGKPCRCDGDCRDGLVCAVDDQVLMNGACGGGGRAGVCIPDDSSLSGDDDVDPMPEYMDLPSKKDLGGQSTDDGSSSDTTGSDTTGSDTTGSGTTGSGTTGSGTTGSGTTGSGVTTGGGATTSGGAMTGP